MLRVRSFLALGILAVLGSGVGPSTAGAEPSAFRLHVQGHSGTGSVVNIDVPWDSGKAGSPFNFTAEACDDIAPERLRWAWAALQRAPEGRRVTIETRDESILASRWAGYLVLEPQRDNRNEHHSRIKIPDYIVDTILDHDGRLAGRDIERLVRERGKVTLVKVNSDLGGVTVWLDRAEDASD
jgi:hypothetical protein